MHRLLNIASDLLIFQRDAFDLSAVSDTQAGSIPTLSPISGLELSLIGYPPGFSCDVGYSIGKQDHAEACRPGSTESLMSTAFNTAKRVFSVGLPLGDNAR